MDTFFAPAGRDTPTRLKWRAALVQNTPLLQLMMDALPASVVILNENRQILAANRALLRMLNVEAMDIIGKRTGEVVGCAFWREGPDGCGTTKHCLTCGAVVAMLESQKTQGQATQECRLTLDTTIDGGARDLKVTATAISVAAERLTVCCIEDISQQKRLAVLGRVFFHDVLNTAGGIQGFAHLLKDKVQEDSRTFEDLHQLGNLSDQLINEIESQRDLTLAESGDLEAAPEAVQTTTLLEDLRTLYSRHAVAEGRQIHLVDIWDGRFVSDPRLLSRVLGNMLKNALEATAVGDAVTVRCAFAVGEVTFSVHNNSVMPEETRIQVFQRSFSTKTGTGRGIGTYSMKLLGEHYLGGKVAFTSQESQGTTFTITLPWVLTTGQDDDYASADQ